MEFSVQNHPKSKVVMVGLSTEECKRMMGSHGLNAKFEGEVYNFFCSTNKVAEYVPDSLASRDCNYMIMLLPQQVVNMASNPIFVNFVPDPSKPLQFLFFCMSQVTHKQVWSIFKPMLEVKTLDQQES